MTSKELRVAMKQLGYTVRGFADYMGISPSRVNAWRNRAKQVPGPVARHVELLLKLDDIQSGIRQQLTGLTGR